MSLFKPMKNILFLSFFFLIRFITIAQKPIIEWQKNYGGSSFDKAKSIVQTIDGGYIIGGYSQSTNIDLSTNKGDYDFWIIKIDNLGQIQWKKSLGGSGYDYVQQVIQTPDDGYLFIGYTSSTNGDITNPLGQIDIWAAKFNSAGTIQWKKNFGGSFNDWGVSICLTDDENYIISGTTGSNDQNVSYNHGNFDFWVIKINTNGNILWEKTYGGSGLDYLSFITKTADGGYAVVGYANSTDGNFLQNKGGTDIWLLKINSNGVFQWANNFGGSLDDTPRALIEDSDGNFVIVGETYSLDFDAIENHNGYWTRDYIVIKTNSVGQKLWAHCYGGTSEEYGRSIFQTFDGEYAIAGESYSTNGDPTGNHGSAEYWLIKLDPTNGAIRWEKNMGGTGHDEATSLARTFDNGYVIVGNSAPPVSNDVTSNYGLDDIWVVKLKNNECPKKLNLVSDIPLGNIEFKAIEKITSQAKILNTSSNILYSTGKSVILNPGFKTESGAIFEAKIEGCN